MRIKVAAASVNFLALSAVPCTEELLDGSAMNSRLMSTKHYLKLAVALGALAVVPPMYAQPLPNYPLQDGASSILIPFSQDGHTGSYQLTLNYNASAKKATISHLTYALNIAYLSNPKTAADSASNDIAIVGSALDTNSWVGRAKYDASSNMLTLTMLKDSMANVQKVEMDNSNGVKLILNSCDTVSAKGWQVNVSTDSTSTDKKTGKTTYYLRAQLDEDFTPKITVGMDSSFSPFGALPCNVKFTLSPVPEEQVVFTPVNDLSKFIPGADALPGLMAHVTINSLNPAFGSTPRVFEASNYQAWISPLDFALEAGFTANNGGKIYFQANRSRMPSYVASLYKEGNWYPTSNQDDGVSMLCVVGGDTLSADMSLDPSLGPNKGWPARYNFNPGKGTRCSVVYDADAVTGNPYIYDNVIALWTGDGKKWLAATKDTNDMGVHLWIDGNRFNYSIGTTQALKVSAGKYCITMPLQYPGMVSKRYPPNGQTFTNVDRVNMGWGNLSVVHADGVRIQVSRNGNFAKNNLELDTLFSANDTSTVFNVNGKLNFQSTDTIPKFWRLQTNNKRGPGAYSPVWVMKFAKKDTIQSGVHEMSGQATTDFAVFPNPTTGEVFLKLPTGSLAHINLCDLLGRVVRTYSVGHTQEFTFNISDLPAGAYALRDPASGKYWMIVKE